MLDFFLYRLLFKEYFPETYDSITDFHQQSWFSKEDSSVNENENAAFTEKYNPVNLIANSRYGKSITLIILFVISSISTFISFGCKGAGKSMYMTYSFLFPITHFMILIISKITGGKLIGCNYEQIKGIKKLKTETAKLSGGKKRNK